MRKTLFIADCHFCHENVIRFDNRPYSSVEEMNYCLIDNWNKAVDQKDTVYILGDFIWKTSKNWLDIIGYLKGKKVLIRGNHDPRVMPDEINKHFVEITDYKEIVENGQRIIMSHYPIPFYKGDYKENVWMFYGHVHRTREYEYLKQIRNEIKKLKEYDGKPIGNFVNVGCMMPWMNYTPRTFEEIINEECKYIM